MKCRVFIFILAMCVLLSCTSTGPTEPQEPENQPPNKPTAQYPLSGVFNVFKDITLFWTASDPEEDPLTYDIYFGSTSPPPLLQSNLGVTQIDQTGLQYGSTYYWKINVEDDHGNTTEGDIWYFEIMDSSDNYQQYYLATGTYSYIWGNYSDTDPQRGPPWIALSSYGTEGAEVQWQFQGFTKAAIETLIVGAYSFDDGWDMTGGEHYHLFNHETQVWDFLFDSNKSENWHSAQITGASAKSYVNEDTDVVILRIVSGYTDHTHIREVFCKQADLDTALAAQHAPGTITIIGGMEQPELRN